MVLEQTKSEYQTITIQEDPFFGKIMLLDNEPSIDENMSFYYHETITNIALCVKPEVENVLIIGGGNGGIANEILKHKEVKNIDIVEIDELILSISKKYFSFAKSLEKANLFIEDGFSFVQKSKDKIYDIVLIDVPEFKKNKMDKVFFGHVSRILKNDGIMVARSFDMDFEFEEYKNKISQARDFFRFILPANSKNLIATYKKTSLIFASKKYHPLADLIVQKIDMLDNLNFYDDEIHKASFAIGKDLFKKLLPFIKI
jgi:spermidine synthase